MPTPRTPPYRRRLLVASGAIALVAALLGAGRPGVVTTNAEQVFEGDVVESDTNVTIVRGGMRVTLDRAEVSRIEYSTYAERFKQQLAALAANDVDGRVSLAREAMQRRELDCATLALDQALDIDPLDREARRLNGTLAAQIALHARQLGQATTGPAAAAGPRRVKGLSPDQINEVRQSELQPGDRVRIRFANNVRKRYADSQPNVSFQAFARLNDTDQALAILRNGTREMREDVEIQTDPSSIDYFNKRLHTAVVQGCATSACHGGTRAGTLQLLGERPDAATMITNFYLLNAWRRDRPVEPGSVFGGGQDVMIDRGRAERSLLYECMLPRSLAETPHPEVRGWNGVARSRNDRIALDLAAWLERQLKPMTPSYTFTYSPRGDAAGDGGAASTAPATRPGDE